MNTEKIPLTCELLILVFLLVPVAQVITPIWIAKASPSSDLESIVVSDNGSVIVAGGDKLYIVSGNGTIIWSGYAGSAIDMASDGKYIATIQGSQVRVFNSAGTSLWARDLTGPLKDVSIAPDGSMVAVGGADVLRSWSINGTDLGRGKTDVIWNLAVAPGQDQVFVATNGGIRSFNATFRQQWKDDVISPNLVAMGGPGKGIVTAGINRINHYSNNGNLTWEYSTPWGNILAIAYSRDGSTIILGTDGNTVAALDSDGRVLWNTKTGFWVQSVGVSNDGSIIAAGSMDKNLYVYDHGGRLLGSYMVNDMMETNSLAVSGDGSRVFAKDSSKIYAFDPYNLDPATTGTVTTGTVTTGTVTTGTVTTGTGTTPVSTVNMTAGSTPATEVPAPQTSASLAPVLTTTPLGTTFTVSTEAAEATTKAGIPGALVLVSLGAAGIIMRRRR